MQPERLAAANENHHSFIVRQTKAAIDELTATGERISFYSVARKAQVSRSTLYRCRDLRMLVERARRNAQPSRTLSISDETRIAELEDQLCQVTHERDRLKQVLRNAPSARYAFTDLYKTA